MIRSLFIIFVFVGTTSLAQTSLWLENFENGCASGCTTFTGVNGAWTFVNVPNGGGSGIPAGCCNYASPNGASSNRWYVSCAEDGQPNGACGSGCISNETLHMGSVTLGDLGAAYDAARVTCKMAQSPLINTTAAGTNTITCSFEHIRYGDASVDCAQLLYSVDGGTTWLFLANPIPTVTCCMGPCDGQDQGVWTTLNYTLPATCNNITNFRLGVNWKNNGSGGADPSFAINDLRLTYNAAMPVELLSFNGFRNGKTVKLEWQTATESNNAFFELERSVDGIAFTKIGKINGHGNSSQLLSYSFVDAKPITSLSYYRLKQVDFDGKATFSDVIRIAAESDVNSINVFLNNNNSVHVSINADNDESINVQLLDMTGKRLISKNYSIIKGNNGLDLNVSEFPSGTYLVYVKDKDGLKYSFSEKVVK